MNSRFITKVVMMSVLCISPATAIICCCSSPSVRSGIELVVAYEFTRRHFDGKLRQACADIKRENPGISQDSWRACFEEKRAGYKPDILKYASIELQLREDRAPIISEEQLLTNFPGYFLREKPLLTDFPGYLLGEKPLPPTFKWALTSYFMDRYMCGKSPILPTYDNIMDPNFRM